MGPNKGLWIAKDFDGIACIEYYRDCVLKAVQPGDDYFKLTGQWFTHVAATLHANLTKLNGSQRAKFSRKLGSS